MLILTRYSESSLRDDQDVIFSSSLESFEMVYSVPRYHSGSNIQFNFERPQRLIGVSDLNFDQIF